MNVLKYVDCIKALLQKSKTMFVGLTTCLSVDLSFSQYIFLSVLCQFICLSVSISICQFICLSVYLSFSQSICLSALCQSIFLTVSLIVYQLYVSLSISLSFCLLVNFSVYSSNWSNHIFKFNKKRLPYLPAVSLHLRGA